MGQWADWVDKLNRVKLSKNVTPINIPGVTESRKVISERQSLDTIPDWDVVKNFATGEESRGYNTKREQEARFHAPKAELGYGEGNRFNSLLSDEERKFSQNRKGTNEYYFSTNEIEGITYRGAVKQKLPNGKEVDVDILDKVSEEYRNVLKSTETAESFINKEMAGLGQNSKLYKYYNALKSTGNLNFNLYTSTGVKPNLIATYINLFRKGNKLAAEAPSATATSIPRLRSINETKDILKKSFLSKNGSADRRTKFIIANRQEEEQPSHIVRVVYYVPKRIMEVTFEKSSRLGNVCVFFEIPLKVGFEICNALEKNLKRTYKSPRAHDPETRHLAGILLWDYIRFRTTVTSVRYPYTMLGEGLVEDVSTAETLSELGEPDEHGIVPTQSFENVAFTDNSLITITEANAGDIDETKFSYDDIWKKSTSTEDREYIKTELTTLLSAIYEEEEKIVDDNGWERTVKEYYDEVISEDFKEYTNTTIDAFLAKHGYKVQL